MKLRDLFTSEAVSLDLESVTKDDLLKELVDRLWFCLRHWILL